MSVAISSDVTSGKAPLNVQFSVTGLDTTDSATWEYGDGLSGNEINPQHKYTAPGTYTAVFKAIQTAGGCCTSKVRLSLTITVTEQVPVSQLDKCFHIGLGDDVTGIGPTEFSGDSLAFPSPHLSSIEIRDNLNQSRQMTLSDLTNGVYELSRVNGPSGSNLTRKFTDQASNNVAVEISGEIDFPEVTGGSPNEEVEHLNSYFSFEPYDKSKAGQTGYDSVGFRLNQKIDINAFIDGALVASDTVTDIPPNGEISFLRKLRGKSGRLQLVFAASEFILTGHRQYWKAIDHAFPSILSTMSFAALETELNTLLMWYSRGANLFTDRIYQKAIEDLVTKGLSVSIGADGKSNSGMHTTGTPGAYPLGFVDVGSGDIDVLFWSNQVPTSVTFAGVALTVTAYSNVAVNGFTLYRANLN